MLLNCTVSVSSELIDWLIDSSRRDECDFDPQSCVCVDVCLCLLPGQSSGAGELPLPLPLCAASPQPKQQRLTRILVGIATFYFFKFMLFNRVLIGISHLIQFTLVPPPNHRPSLTLLVYSNCVTSQNTGQWASRMSSRDLMLPHFHQVMSSFWPQPNCAVWQGAEAWTVCFLFSIFGSRPNEKKCKRINDLTGIIGSSTEHYKSERDLSALHSYSLNAH